MRPTDYIPADVARYLFRNFGLSNQCVVGLATDRLRTMGVALGQLLFYGVMRVPRQQRGHDSTDGMLRAALELVTEGGLASVTVAAVSRRSGCSNGALYHRFGSRGDLLSAAQAVFLSDVEEQTQRALQRARAEDDDRAAIRFVVTSYLDIFTEHRAAFRAFIIEGNAEPELRSRGQDTSHRIQTWVIDWIESRWGATSARSAGAVYLVMAVSLHRMVFEEGFFLAQHISELDLINSVVDSVHTLVTQPASPHGQK